MNTKMRTLFASLLCMVMMLGLFTTPSHAVTVIDESNIMLLHPAHLENPDTMPMVIGNCQIDTSYNSNSKVRKPIVTVQNTFGDYLSTSNFTVTYEKESINVGTTLYISTLQL